ncbi:hypothetical protein Lal_00000451 [Lupinus albus]|uniref:Putative universal stress protein A n=1 Tax=Lupinus albus TaxID=3870 RepID=A0A6A5LF12_LUPAL|nr:putative universal stress protein A [Lupinus albus]KAF1861034.1 hypothetical protein Lal_00000451 [Lupinus albus]
MSEVAENERRILVAIDEGDESIYALSWCLKNLVFQNSKDTLILLYVKPPRAVFSSFDYPADFVITADVMANMDKHSQQVADRVIETATRLCNNIQNVEMKVGYGDPRDVICEMTQKLGADILVMGSHGYGVIKRTFLGSVSNHCAQNAKCSVLIVKRPK